MCLPARNLLDKPIGDKIFGKETLAFGAASSLAWSKLWLTAIAAATLKHVGQADGLKVNPKLARVIADDRLHGVIDHFVRLLDLSPSELLRSATDADGHLVPRLRAVSSPIAIFVDGIDEYFNKHIESRATHPSVTGGPVAARLVLRAARSRGGCLPAQTAAARSTSSTRWKASARSS